VKVMEKIQAINQDGSPCRGVLIMISNESKNASSVSRKESLFRTCNLLVLPFEKMMTMARCTDSHIYHACLL